MQIDIGGRLAFVTGASRGIGKAVTHSLLEAGVSVIATARDLRRLNDLKTEFARYGDQLKTIVADLRRDDQVDALCRQARAFGDPDIVVNNAGILHFDLLEHLTDELIHESFSVNVIAPMMICRAFVPAMIRRRWGRVVNICSSSAYTGGGTPRHCVYSASKHALLGFSRALDEEVRQHDIRVSTVSPAGVSTDMVSGRGDLDATTFMEAADVAEAVMYQITSSGQGIAYEMRLWRMKR
jgi:3-oxoacyl-[acyl-carrier protein] reductase